MNVGACGGQMTPANTTCHCYSLASAMQSVSTTWSRRRRLATGDEMAADLALVVGSVAEGFLSTLTRTPLTASTLAKNMVVFITMGSFLGMALLLVVYGYWKDEQDRRKAPPKPGRGKRPLGATQKTHGIEASGKGTLCVSPADVSPVQSPRSTGSPRSHSSSSSSSSPFPSGDELEWGSGGEASEIEQTPRSPAGVVTQPRQDKLESTLPDFARARSYWQLALRVLSTRHDWFAIAFVYSTLLPRGVRVAMVTTATLTVMFLNAVLYDLAFPDHTPCAAYATRGSCLSEPSAFYRDKLNCKWSPEAQTCSFNEPSGDFFTIILISVATAIVRQALLS